MKAVFYLPPVTSSRKRFWRFSRSSILYHRLLRSVKNITFLTFLDTQRTWRVLLRAFEIHFPASPLSRYSARLTMRFTGTIFQQNGNRFKRTKNPVPLALGRQIERFKIIITCVCVASQPLSPNLITHELQPIKPAIGYDKRCNRPGR